MTGAFCLFEVSWEVCNKVGGIHTVLSSKAKTLVARHGDDYILVGPWLLSDTSRHVPFDEEPGEARFVEACREMGLAVQVGRWRIPGRPRTILVEFSSLLDDKDGVLSGLWEDYRVDSISGGWDYVEPVLFGHAAGRVIEKWWETHLAASHRRAVLQAHEWMTASALLYVKRHIPSIGTVFTTHATMLGRALSSLGHSPDDGLGGSTPGELAVANDVAAKHSMEGVAAREADVFTTVSEITAREAELLHGRAPDPLLPNGIDLDVVDEIAASTPREEARATLDRLAETFLGEPVDGATYVCISGRYEFHNKGIDLLLDALAQVDSAEGRRVVAWILVPAGNSGVRSAVLERLRGAEPADGPLGISTHNLFEDDDPVQARCASLGLANELGARVKVVHVPIYLAADDGFLNMPYEAVLRAMDLSCFPSYYEPWGYTPQESLAVGVPTITSDYAGFGRWASAAGLGREDGVSVLLRQRREWAVITTDLVEHLETWLREGVGDFEVRDACRRSAQRTAWADLVASYDQAHRLAYEAVRARLVRGVPQTRRPKVALPVQPAPEGQRPRLSRFDVAASLPAALAPLERLARNLWWSWDADAPRLFEELAPRTWRESGHNPLVSLRRVPPEDLQRATADEAYLARVDRALKRFDAYLGSTGTEPAPATAVLTRELPVAYFCAEYGVHESLPIYSGGLGMLAGDHVKSASDLNVPMVAIGLFYRMGYMTQRLDSGGGQIDVDVENDPRRLPLEGVKRPGGEALEIVLSLPGRELALRAWRAQVGRVELYLLDSDAPANQPDDRDITRNLYGGDAKRRIQQEIVLGRGGYRLLRELGIRPAVYHINEGHAAFLSLERIAQLVRESGLTFDEAREFVRATTVFTTHTPVPAGHDCFSEDLVRRYFSDVADWVGVPWERFWSLGRAAAQEGEFNMTYLALSFSSFVNGVSRLHGLASRKLLHEYWPRVVEGEVPVHSITNGVHLATWTHPGVAEALGVRQRPIQGGDFARASAVGAAAKLWDVRRTAKARLLACVRAHVRRAFLARSDSPLLLSRTLEGLSEDALLIGFARRFAPYKRAGLVFQDLERLRAILDDDERPVRVLIAGKAHPRDEIGKGILREIVQRTREDPLVGRVVFLENYDAALARLMVQGVDVWLNNPVRMQEASGTSGMKAATNGALNLSIADGWWPEADDGENGWTIADRRRYAEQSLQDQLDAASLYGLLEEEIVPLYFERDPDGVPLRWLERVLGSLETIPVRFNSDRMVLEYLERAYEPLAQSGQALQQDHWAQLKRRTEERLRVRRGFAKLRIASASIADLEELAVGDEIEVRVEVELDELRPEDVLVEIVFDKDTGGELHDAHTVELGSVGDAQRGLQAFEGRHRIEHSGSYAYGIRVRPRSALDPGDSSRDLVLWA